MITNWLPCTKSIFLLLLSVQEEKKKEVDPNRFLQGQKQ